MTDPRPDEEGPHDPTSGDSLSEPLPSQARREWITYVERDAHLSDASE